MYLRGTQFWFVIISSSIAALTAAELFLPVYYDLNLSSVNQYLKIRYNSERVRLAGTFTFLLATVPYMGVSSLMWTKFTLFFNSLRCVSQTTGCFVWTITGIEFSYTSKYCDVNSVDWSGLHILHFDCKFSFYFRWYQLYVSTLSKGWSKISSSYWYHSGYNDVRRPFIGHIQSKYLWHFFSGNIRNIFDWFICF